MYLLWIARIIFVAVAYAVGYMVSNAFPGALPLNAPSLVACLAGLLVAVELVFQRSHLRTLVAVMIGLAIGVLATAVVTVIALLFTDEESLAARIVFVKPFLPLIALFCCYLAVTVVLQTKDQFRFIVPYVDIRNFGRPTGGLILDSSALVDGRISGLVDGGLVAEQVVVPEFVVKELHALADSADAIKRGRGRRALDVLLHIQSSAETNVRLERTDYPSVTGVDVKLIRLAKDMDARIATCDLNLAKVAASEDVKIVNLAEVARSLRQVLLPGEHLTLALAEPGEQRNQGRGYLADGTMVVVEDARRDVGKVVEVVISRSHESAGGQMYFARKAEEGSGEARAEPPQRSPEANDARNAREGKG